MKEPYTWDYHIKIKTKEGTYDYEKENLENIDLLLEQHPNYEELQATHNKPRCDKCHIELNEVFIQHNQNRSYKLCKKCNERYLQYDKNIKKLEKIRGKK